MKKKKLELKSTLDSLLIENATIESERNFALLFETLPEKITNASNDGKSFYYNKSWTDYTGASQIDLVSNGWSNWIHADDQVEAGLRWANSVKTHCNFDMELRIRNKTRKYRWHNNKARYVDLEKCFIIGMNDYLAKPVDERQLYTKIVNLLKKPLNVVNNLNEKPEAESSKSKYIDLSYLLQRTKSNPKLMAEMISIYLEQTPPLLMAMKESLQSKDWKLLQSAAHKMIPSFAIMGMNTSFEDMAKKIHEYAVAQHLNESIEELVLQLEAICNQACSELAEELNNYKK